MFGLIVGAVVEVSLYKNYIKENLNQELEKNVNKKFR